MKEADAWKQAAYTGLLIFCASFIALLPTSLHFLESASYSFLFGIIAFAGSRTLLHYTVYAKVRQINKILHNALRHDHSRGSRGNSLDRLSFVMQRLIREKTSEIDNLKELERLRKEFLGNVAHELRSPLFNIQGYIHTLLEGAMEDEEVSKRFLDKAAKNVDHLSALVEDLVTISKIEAGELKMEFTNFNIIELVQEVIEILDLSAKQKNITLQPKYTVESPCMVNADRAKIRQVLINLVGNSIKYGRENGRTNINVLDMKGDVTIEVADNGEGIAEEHLSRIFERFYRVDKSRARNQRGTGLGLAIAKHFIEAHKQKILVSSHEGVGSIFSFNLTKTKLYHLPANAKS